MRVDGCRPNAQAIHGTARLLRAPPIPASPTPHGTTLYFLEGPGDFGQPAAQLAIERNSHARPARHLGTRKGRPPPGADAAVDSG